MNFYQTISIRTHSSGEDEFTEYEGYDRQAAIDAAITADGYLTASERRNGALTEIREFDLPKPVEDMDGDEWCDLVGDGYNLVKW